MQRWSISHIALDEPQPEIMLNSLSRESKIELSNPVSASAVDPPNKLVIANKFPYLFNSVGQLVVLL
jgi:hypothetical protein